MWLNESYEAIHDKALHLVQEGKLDEAIAEYRRGVDRLLRITPDTLRRQGQSLEMLQHMALELANTLQRAEQYDDAIALADRLGAFMPELALGWKREAARFKVMKGDVEGAISDLENLLAQNPGEPLMYSAYAEALVERGDFEKARQSLVRAIDLTPDREQKAMVYGVLGEVHMRAGNLREMMRAWEMAAGLSPEAATFLPFGYDLFFRTGRVDEARPYIERDPDPARRGLYLGIANELQGDRRAAESQWRRAFRQRPEEDARNVGMWAEAGLRLGQAKAVVDELLPRIAAGQATSGLAMMAGMGLAMLGERARAEEMLSGVAHDLLASRGQQLLPRGAWLMLDRLVGDQEIKDSLRRFFETEPPRRPGAPKAESQASADEATAEELATDAPDAQPAESGPDTAQHGA